MALFKPIERVRSKYSLSMRTRTFCQSNLFCAEAIASCSGEDALFIYDYYQVDSSSPSLPR